MIKLNLLRILPAFAAIFAFSLTVPAVAVDEYATSVISAASYMQQGNYDKAVQQINRALTERSDDPLVHICLGTLLLHTRQSDKAFGEFTAASKMAKDHPLASYGFALYYLANGKTDDAKRYFEKASAGGYDASPALAYISALCEKYPEGDSVDPVLRQITAQGLFDQGKYDDAQAALASMTSEWTGFDESFGSAMTFDPAKPVSMSGKALSKPYKTPTQAEPKLKTVSGNITLKADLGKIDGVAYVLYYVDDDLIGMINHYPYECQWNTDEYANSPHTIKIEGHSEVGSIMTEKTIRVTVGNKGKSAADPIPGEDAKLVEARIWDCLKLKPSKRLAYYTLATCAEVKRDSTAATAALEHVVAIDPSYKDASTRLIKHYTPITPYKAIWRVKTQQKIAAITFDDGPNPLTSRILDILAKKGVKATFFVVGSMAMANQDMLKRMATEGHEIENHTYSHRNLRYLPDSEVQKELLRNVTIIRELTGQVSRYYRAPGGHQNGNLAMATGKFGFNSVFWTVNVAKDEGTKPAQIIKRVTSGTVPGSIILMHNVEDVTVLALPKIIDDLKAKGYKLVTFSELVKAGQ